MCLKMKSQNLQQGSIKEHRRGGYPQKGFSLEERERRVIQHDIGSTINERAMGWRYTGRGKALAGRNRRVEAIEATVESSFNGAFGTTAEEPFAKMSIYVLSFDLIEKN